MPIGDSGITLPMTPWIYLVLFAAVILADQLSKRWALQALHPVEPSDGRALGWARTSSPPLERIGRGRACAIWLLAGAAGAVLCATTPGGAIAALGGVTAWAAAGSNLGE